MNMIEAAQGYVSQGWKVFPLRPRSKKPLPGTHGKDDATSDPAQVQRWWQAMANANIAVACGAASGIIVIDLDAIDDTNAHDGQATWQALTARYGDTETRQQRTGGGGLQLFFLHPGAGVEIGNRAQLLPGIDVRGDGGYTVVGPSIHPDTGKAYEWTNDIEPQQPPIWLLGILFDDDARLEALKIAMPDETERLAWSKESWGKSPELRATQPAKDSPTGSTVSADSDEMQHWLSKTKESAYQAVASAPKGQRNAVLNREAYSLAGLIPHISRDEIDRLMLMAAEKSGYVADDGEAAVMAAIKSAIDSGSKAPRQLPDLTPARPAVVIPAMDNDDAGFVPSDAGAKAAAIIAEADRRGVDLVNAQLTDAGNAECLAALYGDRLRYDHISKGWRIWDNQRWAVDHDGEAYRLALATVRARRGVFNDEISKAKTATQREDAQSKWKWSLKQENAGKIDALLKIAVNLIDFATLTMQYDRNRMLVNAGDVTIDLQRVEPRDNKRDDLITQRLGTVYDPFAMCPRWEQFVAEVWPSLPNVQRYIQRLVGYCLTGSTQEHAFFLLHGDGRNGKSVFLNLMRALAGEYGDTTDFRTFDAKTPEAHQFLAGIRAARVVTISEANQGARLDEARIKFTTGGEAVTARELYGKPFNFVPQFKILMAVNHLPRIIGNDTGIWRRVHRIPFAVNFEGREDKQLETKLRAELPGILNWALEGLREWHQIGLSPPKEITDATEEYRQESDVIAQWVNDRCVVGENFRMPAGIGFEDFKKWAAKADIKETFSQVSWGKEMKKRYQDDKVGHKTIYRGLGLIEERFDENQKIPATR